MIFYYICAHQRKGWKASDHKNCVLARKAEAWVLDRIHDLLESEGVMEAAVASAREATQKDLAPTLELWQENQKALAASQSQTDEIVKAITSGNVQGALWQILNEKTAQLQLEREHLLIEQRRLREQLTPLNESFDPENMKNWLKSFSKLALYAEPEELQRLLRLTIRRIEWKSQGNNKVQFYQLAKHRPTQTNCPPAQGADGQWLYTDVCSDIA